MEDSAAASFWDRRYLDGTTPWEPTREPPEIARAPAPQGCGRLLIPGCGTAHEAATFAASGWDVVALDISPVAVARARERLGATAVAVREGDFFAVAEAAFAAIFERAFLCALPPRLRPPWALRVAHLLEPGGLLFGYFLVDERAVERADERADGPPYGIREDELERLLTTAFTIDESRPSTEPLDVFGSAERWMVWRRRSDRSAA